GSTKRRICQELLLLWRASRKQIHHFFPGRFHFLLLDGIADEDRPRWKTRFAGGVFRMEMRRCKEELLVVRRKLRHDLCYRRAVARAQPRIDNERPAVSNNDTYVR